MPVYIPQGCIVRYLLVHLRHYWKLTYIQGSQNKKGKFFAFFWFLHSSVCYCMGKCKTWFQNLAIWTHFLSRVFFFSFSFLFGASVGGWRLSTNSGVLLVAL
jgi:hypothetical protein